MKRQDTLSPELIAIREKLRMMRERMHCNALATMTRRMQRRLLNYRVRVQKRGQALDEALWKEFLRRLYPEEKRFLRHYFPEVREALAGEIQGTPLAETIAKRRGRWPWPKGWHRHTVKLAPDKPLRPRLWER